MHAAFVSNPCYRGIKALFEARNIFFVPFGSRGRFPVLRAGHEDWLGHQRFMWVHFYWGRITDGSLDVLKEVNSRLRAGHRMGREEYGVRQLGCLNCLVGFVDRTANHMNQTNHVNQKEEIHFGHHVGGKNFTMIVWSIPGGGGRTSASLASASSAD